MLIINADDLGRNQRATDNILRCHALGRISSASAMVFMADSERAAELARGAGLETGLHVNYSELFTDTMAPLTLRKDQQKTFRFLKLARAALVFYNPFLIRQFREVFVRQHEEYVRLYGCPPAHIDGHQHMHLATNVLVHEVIPADTRVRRNFSFGPGQKSRVNRWYRSAVDQWLARRHILTDYFYGLQPLLEQGLLRDVVELSMTSNVEVMTHPELEADLDFLLSAEFHEVLGTTELSPYAALERSGPSPDAS